jgi:hypothetical protein
VLQPWCIGLYLHTVSLGDVHSEMIPNINLRIFRSWMPQCVKYTIRHPRDSRLGHACHIKLFDLLFNKDDDRRNYFQASPHIQILVHLASPPGEDYRDAQRHMAYCVVGLPAQQLL